MSASELVRQDRLTGRRIRARRLQLGLSQKALGDALGLSYQQVQKYEKGLSRIGAGRLQQIAEALNVSAKTVQAHFHRIKQKLQLSTATELMREATRWHHDSSNF